ncbi:MAG: beta-phosphoglucomutase family hydrolase [Chloroflexi bacterium]|nr:MAG: beta-phosphoglucomutase family hydrolase [Chloroflexota bacterium]
MSLGLPSEIQAGLFDLDGVITRTAEIHALAWKEVFDEFLTTKGQPLFDPIHDYDQYVDGKPREDGVRDFLASRQITVPDETIEEIASRKDSLFLDLIHHDGVQTYDGSIRYLHAAQAAGLKLAVVSSSRHTTEVLTAGRLDRTFDAQVDGIVAEREHLAGKPAPDTYLMAARLLNVEPKQAAVYEDALAGVQAGRAGGFGFVVGIDRAGQADALYAHGADVVVKDLAELLTE